MRKLNRIIKIAASAAMVVTLLGQSPVVSFAQRGHARGDTGVGSGSASPAVRVIGRRAVLIDAIVTGVSGSTLTVTKNSVTYSVDATAARLRARFWGNLALSDVQVNDHLNIWGTWVDQAKTSIKARLIRDLSDQRRGATFLGKITQVGSNTLVLETIKRGNQTVDYVSGPIVNRRQQTIAFSALSVGDRVRVRGLWNRTNTNILIDTSQRKNSQIKDFSLPAKSPKPSAVVIPSAMP